MTCWSSSAKCTQPVIKAVLPGDGYPAHRCAPFSAMLYSAHAVYGQENTAPRFWANESGGICALSGDALIISGQFDPQELSSLWAITGAAQLRGRKEDVAPLAQHLQKEPKTRPILWLPHGSALRNIPQEPQISAPSPARIYPLLQTVFGLPQNRFPAWYCEVSHKIRHGLGNVCAIEQDGTVAATAGIYHQNQEAALLSSVATHPDHRRRGYAAALCGHLAQSALEQGRCPFVICRDEAANRVYQRIGFAFWGEEWTLQ